MEEIVLNFPESARLGWWLLIAVALIVFSTLLYRWQFSRRWGKKLINFNLRSSFKTWLKYGLFLSGAGLVYLSILGPRWGYQEVREQQKDIDVVILIDVSKSMSVEDVKPNRMDRAKFKIYDFIDLVTRSGNYRIALTVFGGSSFVYCPLTRDYNSLRNFVRNIELGMVSEQGTDLALGLQTALSAFPEDDDGQKVIIVFTDGENHQRDVVEMAEQARQKGVILYSIGVGTPNGELVPIKDENGKIVDYLKDEQGNIIISKLDQASLIEISELTGGEYFSSSLGSKDFEFIVGELENLSKNSDRERIIKSKKSRYQIFTLLAIILLSIEFILVSRKNPRKTLDLS